MRRRRRDHPRRTKLRSRRRHRGSTRGRPTSAAPVRRAACHRRNATQTPSRGRSPWLARCSGLAVLDRAGASLRPAQMATVADHWCCGTCRGSHRDHGVPERKAAHAMRTAVVTTVHGRAGHLHRQLDGISRSARLPDMHVIVAIDDPAVPDVVAASGYSAHVVHCENGPGPLPVASARNLGALTALDRNADLLVFLDVDCIPGRNMLGRYHEAVADPEHGDALLCGPVTYLPPPCGGEGYPTALEPMINPHPARPAPTDGDIVASTDYELFWSLSFALTASAWRRIGGFCDALPRIRRRGHRLRPDGMRRRCSDAMGRRGACLSSVPSRVGSPGGTSARHSA